MHTGEGVKAFFKNTFYLGLPEKETVFSFTPGMSIRELLEKNDICFKQQGVAFVIEGHLEKASYTLKDGDVVTVIPIIVGG
jgi:sulfur carrier protein ThiS